MSVTHIATGLYKPRTGCTGHTTTGYVAQWWQNIGLWPASFPCPALDLQLMG